MSEQNRKKRFSFLPPGLNLKDGAWQYHRGVALMILLVIITVLSFLCFAAFNIMQMFYGFNLQLEIAISAAILAIQIIEIAIFYRYANVKISSMVFVYIYFIVALMLVMISGGYQSPLIIFLLTCTVITFRIASREDGIMNAIYVALAGTALAVMELLEYQAPNLLLGLDRSLLFTIAWIITMVIFSACLATFHHGQKIAGRGA